ncbi:ion transporter [Neptunitalea lumnitzerae]|uniref:Ion transport domain-containing protein n=1 Tax=Neptunitalea lumnitzerae TaxID=2965509 RepID=A0ABQ5MEX2_9FLAO|nr:ion transporter [Neptunitalea sp. Y10]GLB47938.1 hypothetical protein Y10_03060 [Neptunitalea sp. Y10]
MKYKVYCLLNNNKSFVIFIYSLIIANVLALILASYDAIYIEFKNGFKTFEIFSIIVFTIEYLLRLWSSNVVLESSDLVKENRFSFFFSTLGIIDLVSILPFYLPFIFPFDFRIVRILRLFRLLRIFKLGRYSKALKTISQVLKDTKSELLITVFIAFVLLIFSSTFMYYVEHDVQPSNFASIGHSLWWAVATLTTVGYGDVYPITPIGKLLSAIIALIGIGFVALPTGILSSAFIERLQNNKTIKVDQCGCPHCGRVINK